MRFRRRQKDTLLNAADLVDGRKNFANETV